MSGVGTTQGTRYSKILSINSNDREITGGGNRSSNFTINLGQNLQECKAISYKASNFYNNFYNVRGPAPGNNTFNNHYSFDFKSASPIATLISPGFYNASSLITQMISDIELIMSTVYSRTIVLNYTISSTSGLITLTFTSSTLGGDILTVDDTVLTPQNYGGYGPWQLLGFTPQFSIPVGTSLTGTNLPSLGGYTQVNVQSNALAPRNCYRENGLVSDWFVTIPVTAPFLGLNSDRCFVDDLCMVTYDTPRTLNRIDITIVDHDGNEVDFKGTPFNMDVRVYTNSII